MKKLTLFSVGLICLSVVALFVSVSRASAASPVSAQEAKSSVPSWTVDSVHSCAMFRVRHMGAGFFWGRFNDVTGTIAFNPEDAKSLGMDITIDVNSVDSGNESLDKHLKSPDFFDSKEFPKITFKSTSVKQVPTTKRSDDPGHCLGRDGNLQHAWCFKGTDRPGSLLGCRGHGSWRQGRVRGGLQGEAFRVRDQLWCREGCTG